MAALRYRDEHNKVDDKTFIKVVSDEDSKDEAPILWSAFAGWEVISTGWTMKYVKSLTDKQLIAEFEKIRMAVADLKSHELRRTLK
ncbi:hypothetical protein Tco_0710681, partial [Tanacetum coccineum]